MENSGHSNLRYMQLALIIIHLNNIDERRYSCRKHSYDDTYALYDQVFCVLIYMNTMWQKMESRICEKRD